MKLIIRDEKPKDDTCEIWLSQAKDGTILVMSQITNEMTHTEIILPPGMNASHAVNGNFKWEKV